MPVYLKCKKSYFSLKYKKIKADHSHRCWSRAYTCLSNREAMLKTQWCSHLALVIRTTTVNSFDGQFSGGFRGGWGMHPPPEWDYSTHNAPKLAILRSKMENVFWGGGTAPSPDPSPVGRGIPPPHPAPFGRSSRDHIPPPTISGSATEPVSFGSPGWAQSWYQFCRRNSFIHCQSL